MNKMIERIQKILEDKLNYIRKNIFLLAHNSDYVIGVWFYEKGTGKFWFAKGVTGHSSNPVFKEVVNKDFKNFVRGRVINYKGIIICAIYLDPSISFINKLPEKVLLDIKFKCEDSLGKKIDFVLSDLGEILLEKVQLKEASWKDKEEFFKLRTNKHIKLVQKAIDKIISKNPEWKEFNETELFQRGQVHDASKFEEPERTPYINITWRHKLEKEEGNFDPTKNKGYKTPGLLTNKEENEATLHHILNNDHHPEFWNKKEVNLGSNDKNKSIKCINVTKMPPIAIAEMVADWWAMSEEIGKNTAREWFEKQKDVRWHFSKEQEELINKLLKVLESE